MNKYLFISLFLILTACDKVTIDFTNPPLTQHQKDVKPNTPVPLGSIRAYFGDYYRTFAQHIEKVQPVDSFSNIYTYGEYNNTQVNIINILRCDSIFVIAIYITGYSLDSLPVNQPLPEVYGKYPQICFYPFNRGNWGDPSYYSLAYYIQKCVFIITDKTDDILTGTFDGMLESSTGSLLPISEGEFKIKIFRKIMNNEQTN
ncbi:MAG: hypothetical protein EPN88_07280 [Bacteroidetes bacterium]|nr:MAG: hypothetical protein EPN88_07280 [Bacteroidota bacterium]